MIQKKFFFTTGIAVTLVFCILFQLIRSQHYSLFLSLFSKYWYILMLRNCRKVPKKNFKILKSYQFIYIYNKTLAPWKESDNKSKQHIKRRRHYFANKGLYSQSYDFSSSHVQMWELIHKEGWAPKNSFFWTVVLEKTLESPLDCKEIKPVNPKGNQLLIVIGRTDAEAPILCPHDAKSWLIGNDPDASRDWG